MARSNFKKRIFTYTLNVTLRGIEPPVWRSLQVPAEITLSVLHSVLQIAMGWEDFHLHSFRVGGTLYADPELLNDIPVLDEKKVRLNRVAPTIGSHIVYEYDFGDSWLHDIHVEDIFESSVPLKYPVCMTGGRACPPEDCGGIPGYEDFLEAINNPRHSEHASLLLWAGGSFDPEAFDLAAINEQLRGSF